MTTTTLPPQFCCRCLSTTTDYTTESFNQRTPAEIRAGRAPIMRRFHTCSTCTSEKGR